MPSEIQLWAVTLTLCDLCMDGRGGECHVPGCALYMSAAPDIPVHARAENMEPLASDDTGESDG